MIDREKYLTKVIRFWGFEHPNTIKFAELIENAPDEEVIKAFWNIMKVFQNFSYLLLIYLREMGKVSPFLARAKIKKFFKKSVDNCGRVCYTIIVPREQRKEKKETPQ